MRKHLDGPDSASGPDSQFVNVSKQDFPLTLVMLFQSSFLTSTKLYDISQYINYVYESLSKWLSVGHQQSFS
jgi:hypothetical protein